MRSYERALRLSDLLRSVAVCGVLERWWPCVTDDDRGHTRGRACESGDCERRTPSSRRPAHGDYLANAGEAVERLLYRYATGDEAALPRLRQLPTAAKFDPPRRRSEHLRAGRRRANHAPRPGTVDLPGGHRAGPSRQAVDRGQVALPVDCPRSTELSISTQLRSAAQRHDFDYGRRPRPARELEQRLGAVRFRFINERTRGSGPIGVRGLCSEGVDLRRVGAWSVVARARRIARAASDVQLLPKRRRHTESAWASTTSSLNGSSDVSRRHSGASTNIVGPAPVRM